MAGVRPAPAVDRGTSAWYAGGAAAPHAPSAHTQRLLSSFSEDGWVGYSGGGSVDGNDSGGRRKSIELGRRSGVAGDSGVGVGKGAPGTAVVKANIGAGHRVGILVGDEHDKGLRQLRSGRGDLVITAGDGDVGGGSGNGKLGGVHARQTGGTGGVSDGGRPGRGAARRARETMRLLGPGRSV